MAATLFCASPSLRDLLVYCIVRIGMRACDFRQQKQTRLVVRKYSFSQMAIDVWNKLSTDCVHASSFNMFKNKIDKYLVKAGYT